MKSSGSSSLTPWQALPGWQLSLPLQSPARGLSTPGQAIALALAWIEEEEENFNKNTGTNSQDELDEATNLSLHFRFTHPYTPDLGSGLHFRLGNDSQEPSVSTPSSSGHTLAWEALRTKNHGDKLSWCTLRPLTPSFHGRWQNSALAQRRGTDIHLPHNAPPACRSSIRSLWNKTQVRNSRKIEGVFRLLTTQDRVPHRIPCGGGRTLQLSRLLPYLAPPVKEVKLQALLLQLHKISRLFIIPWFNSAAKQRSRICPWGPLSHERICVRVYQHPSPGAEIAFTFDLPLPQVSKDDPISLFFDPLNYAIHCSYEPPSGWRDVYFYQTRPAIPSGETRRYYHVLNTVLLTRLADGAPIHIVELRLHADLESFCWQLQARLASSQALQLLRQSEASGEPMLVRAWLNGWEWIFSLDTWSENRSFSSAERRISGRSRSASLAAPAAALINLNPSQDRTAEQLAEAALKAALIAENDENPISWRLDWQLPDWLVPGGLYRCAGQSAMRVLNDIAEAAYGRAQTHPSENTIFLQPRYPLPPWQWVQAKSEVLVPESMILALEGRRDRRCRYNAAFVSGTAEGGISAKVSREGTAGELSGPMFTHPLITATEVARARGMGMVAVSGEWQLYRLTLPLFSGDQKPGLLLPGTLLGITSLSNSGWVGQVTGTTLHASLNRRGVLLRQTLDVERFCG